MSGSLSLATTTVHDCADILCPETPASQLCIHCHLTSTIAGAVENSKPTAIPAPPQAIPTSSHCASCGHVFDSEIEDSLSCKVEANSRKSATEELREMMASEATVSSTLVSEWTD